MKKDKVIKLIYVIVIGILVVGVYRHFVKMNHINEINNDHMALKKNIYRQYEEGGLENINVEENELLAKQLEEKLNHPRIKEAKDKNTRAVYQGTSWWYEKTKSIIERLKKLEGLRNREKIDLEGDISRLI